MALTDAEIEEAILYNRGRGIEARFTEEAPSPRNFVLQLDDFQEKAGLQRDGKFGPASELRAWREVEAYRALGPGAAAAAAAAAAAVAGGVAGAIGAGAAAAAGTYGAWFDTVLTWPEGGPSARNEGNGGGGNPEPAPAPAPQPAPPAPAPAPAERKKKKSNLFGWIAAGVGALAIGAAAFMGGDDTPKKKSKKGRR